MQTNTILSADLLDIIFEGRNKDYGAYELRKNYNKRLMIAVAIMLLACLSMLVGSLFGESKIPVQTQVPVVDVELQSIEQPEVVPPPQPAPPVRRQAATTQYTDPKITPDNLVAEEDELSEITELEETQIGKFDQTGDRGLDMVAPPMESVVISTTRPGSKQDDVDIVFRKVEVEAKFPGGMPAWRKYLERNLNAQLPADEGAPAGRYTVTVEFIVDKEGNVSNARAVTVPKECLPCGPEAVKVIQRAGVWEPAIQNGRKVVYQAIQNITFSVEE